MTDLATPPGFDLPRIGKPATRALLAAGVETLAQVSRLSEAQLRDMHGVGPKAVDILRDALAARGLSFSDPERTP